MSLGVVEGQQVVEGEEEKAGVREVVDDEQQDKRKTVDHISEDGQHYSTITHTCFVVSYFQNTSLHCCINVKKSDCESGQQRKKDNGRSINPCRGEKKNRTENLMAITLHIPPQSFH